MSTPLSRSSWTTTLDTPSLETDSSDLMPDTWLTAPSMRSVTSVSISSGAAPGSTVVMTTTGMSTFGNLSTPSPLYPTPPRTNMTSINTQANTGRCTQILASHCMVLLDPLPVLHFVANW